jgi:glycosyltransferase involved in cell wall biosynthesis
MNLAILGTRGVPARYGGFETLAEELGARLVKRGHHVTVYGRSHFVDPDLHRQRYRGVDLRVLPTIRQKYLDTVVHTLLSSLDCLRRDFDAVLICNAANGVFAPLPRLVGMKVALNVDGIERKRRKWSALGRGYYRFGEWLATKLPDVIVSDAEVIRSYYRETYRAESVVIPYGADVLRLESTAALDRFGLEPGHYVLYVSRLEPENNADVLIRAFTALDTPTRLVLVGDAPYADRYKAQLRRITNGDSRIVFTGFVFGEGYRELQSHATCYVQATEVGGTHPALVEAMAFGNCIIANDTQENREVVAEAALLYRFNDAGHLRHQLRAVLDDAELRAEFGRRARARAQERYSWDRITDQYETLFRRLLGD